MVNNKSVKVFQISSELNVGSVGRIAEQIGEAVLANGWKSYIAYARESFQSSSISYKIGSKKDIYYHVIYTRLTDRHGFASKNATNKLIKKIKEVNPDIIHLQHMHGYFINIQILFDFLKDTNLPVVWTFHDCWSFTGHCAYYEFIDCNKWKTQCEKCPQLNEYPKSIWMDNSKKNYLEKKKLFTSVDNITIVPVSNWLEGEVKKSFLKNYHVKTIHNGIDIQQFVYRENDFKHRYNIENKFLILGVASPWDKRKGLKYFIELSKILSDDYKIVLVGLSKKQVEALPANIIGFERTKDVNELAQLYSAADVFLNPTLEEALGLTNIEAQACGTPVITFNSGGSPETIDETTGIVVEKGDINGVIRAIEKIRVNGKIFYSEHCRKRVESLFDKNNKFKEYIRLYESILNK